MTANGSGRATRQDWFSVDTDGLAQLLERRGREFIVYELIQNSWDQNAAQVKVSLAPIAGRKGVAHLVVADDDPDGFADLRHAYTLYAPS